MNDLPRAALQLAVDLLEIEPALNLIEKVHSHVDIVEIGTPLIIEQGLRAVEAVKRRWPNLRVLADVKIMDAGAIEASSAFKRGADIVTVLAVADDATIRGVVAAAREHGGQVMADLINCADPAGRTRQLVDLGVHMVCVHTAYDRRHEGNPLDELVTVRAAASCLIAVAGGLGLHNAAQAALHGADIVVVGGAIHQASDPHAAAAAIKQALRKATDEHV